MVVEADLVDLQAARTEDPVHVAESAPDDVVG
jgi:hypothetical protein